MKAIHKLFAITASLALLSSLSQAALVTNEFITAGGYLLTTNNWSLGVVPFTSNNQIGVIHNITTVNTNNDGAAGTTLLNNKTLLFSGTGMYTSTAARALTTTNANITLRDTSTFYYTPNNTFTLSNSTLNAYDSSRITATKLSISTATVLFNNTSTGIFSSALSVINSGELALNDSASVLLNAGKLNIDASGAYMNFTSTGAVYRQFVGNTNTVAELSQMIVDGKIRAHGLTVSTNQFNVTYTSGLGTSVQLIPEPATVGLMGLAGALVFFLRRQMNKR